MIPTMIKGTQLIESSQDLHSRNPTGVFPPPLKEGRGFTRQSQAREKVAAIVECLLPPLPHPPRFSIRNMQVGSHPPRPQSNGLIHFLKHSNLGR